MPRALRAADDDHSGDRRAQGGGRDATIPDAHDGGLGLNPQVHGAE
jgi:hypothetical protein